MRKLDVPLSVCVSDSSSRLTSYLLQILYQTERYHYSTFGYDLPLRGDGNYVLVLKFAEVYFNAPDQKVISHSVIRMICMFSSS
jgi:hypothetical protein